MADAISKGESAHTSNKFDHIRIEDMPILSAWSLAHIKGEDIKREFDAAENAGKLTFHELAILALERRIDELRKEHAKEWPSSEASEGEKPKEEKPELDKRSGGPDWKLLRGHAYDLRQAANALDLTYVASWSIDDLQDREDIILTPTKSIKRLADELADHIESVEPA